MLPNARLLAELLRLQRWAGGDSVSAARIYGLMHGFESTIKEEKESFGISEETQRKVEDILDDLDKGNESYDRRIIKERLHAEGIDETDAIHVMELCRLESRFPDVVSRLSKECGFHIESRLPEHDWIGSLHFIELVDGTEEANKKHHGVFAPTVPRVGEFIQPENGPSMKVVMVEYKMCRHGDDEGVPSNVLVPYIHLETDE